MQQYCLHVIWWLVNDFDRIVSAYDGHCPGRPSLPTSTPVISCCIHFLLVLFHILLCTLTCPSIYQMIGIAREPQACAQAHFVCATNHTLLQDESIFQFPDLVIHRTSQLRLLYSRPYLFTLHRTPREPRGNALSPSLTRLGC